MKTVKISDIAFNVKHYREKQGWSQTELASIAGLDRKTVNRIENGHYTPTIDTLIKLGSAFGVTTNKLLGS